MLKSNARRASLNAVCAFQALFICVSGSSEAYAAGAKITAVLRTNEGMKTHENIGPRRLMHDVLVAEFARSGNITIVNKENSPNPTKYYSVPYYVGANLIAFDYSETSPTQVSISISLVKDGSGKVILVESRSLMVPKSDVDSSLKLKDRDFDNSMYGKSISALTRVAAQEFEEKVMQEVRK